LPSLGERGGPLHVLWAERRQRHRNTFSHRVIDRLERFPQYAAMAVR
jgi:hypothetical protein